MTNRDYYEILQVSPRAEPEVIEAAYKRLSLKYHPDTNKDPAATEKMKLLNEARYVLLDTVRREQYDRNRNIKVTTPNNTMNAPIRPTSFGRSTNPYEPTNNVIANCLAIVGVLMLLIGGFLSIILLQWGNRDFFIWFNLLLGPPAIVYIVWYRWVENKKR